MRCQRCGYENEVGFRFCENCGAPLPTQTKEENGADPLEIPSFFEPPVTYTGRYSEQYEQNRSKRKSFYLSGKQKRNIGIVLSLAVLFVIFFYGSKFSRQNDEVPPVIESFAKAVREQDRAALEDILLSARTLQAPNPESIDGFLRTMTIAERLEESVRNLRVDWSHLQQDPAYVSELPVKLVKVEDEYRIAVETFSIDTDGKSATVDGKAPAADGVFHDYLMGQYTVESDGHRFPLQLDSTNPHVEDGRIIPPQLQQIAPRQGETTTESVQKGEAVTVRILSDHPQARIRVDGEDRSETVADLPDGHIELHIGDTLQLVELWPGGLGASEEKVIEKSEDIRLSIEYDTPQTRDLIEKRIVAMFVEDAMMLHALDPDGFTTLAEPALSEAQATIRKLKNANQLYAGAYDSISLDPESLELEKTDNGATARILGVLKYVYQTQDADKPPIDIDGLYRTETHVAIELVLDMESGQWLIRRWGSTEESLSDAPRSVLEIPKAQ